MTTVKENTTLVGVSELRKGIEKILDQAQKGLVIIDKRHMPIGVLMSNEEYERIQNPLDSTEDLVLGLIAHSRFRRSPAKDYVDIEGLLK